MRIFTAACFRAIQMVYPIKQNKLLWRKTICMSVFLKQILYHISYIFSLNIVRLVKWCGRKEIMCIILFY